MRKILVIYLLLLTVGCTKQEVTVQHVGALKEIMHEGKFQGCVKLADLPQENLYGLGAVQELRGEILVMDGKAWITKVQNMETPVWEDKNIEATLLVYAQVSEWDTLQISLIKNIEARIAQELATRKVNKASPFILLGKVVSLDYHIINFDLKKGDLTKHKEGAFKATLTDAEVEILGFYATDAKGIYTHHDSNVHMHVKTKSGDKMGHIDAVAFGDHVIQLLLPKS